MNNKVKLIITITVCVVLFAGAGLLYNSLKDKPMEDTTSKTTTVQNGETEASKTTKPANKEPYMLADITIYDEDKNPHKLSDFRGKKVVMNLWATWCGYCVQEMPAFQKVYEQNKDDIVFIMLNVEGTGDSSIPTGKKFIEEKGYNFPIYYDLNNESSKYMNLTRGGIPATFFIGEDGSLVAMQPGAMNEAMLNQGVKMLTEG